MLRTHIYRCISYVVKKYRELNYLYIYYIIQFKKAFKNTSRISEIEKLYEQYINRVRKGEIFPESRHTNNRIFIEYRRKTGGKLTLDVEEYLLKALKGKTSRWFVPHVLSVKDDISKELMNELINTGIKVKDPSYNGSFVKAAIRIYDLEVNKFLLDNYKGSSLKRKKGIIRLMYWVMPSYNFNFETNQKENAIQRHNYFWKNNKFEYIENESDSYRLTYQKNINHFNYKLKELLLNEYYSDTKSNIKHMLSYYLPKSIELYPENLEKLATKYIRDNKASA